MLVIDDFNELVGLETLFRRLGFDVLSLGRDATVSEAILRFPPDLVLATARGRSVDGLKLAVKVKRTNPKSRIILLMQSGITLTNREISEGQVDALVETPFEPRAALKIVCRLLALEPDSMLEKYSKIVSARLFQPDGLSIVKNVPKEAVDQDASFASGSSMSTRVGLRRTEVRRTNEEIIVERAGPDDDEESSLTPREQRYRKFLQSINNEVLPPMAEVSMMREAQKRLAIDSAPDRERQELIEKEKREFVRAMMSESAGFKEQTDGDES